MENGDCKILKDLIGRITDFSKKYSNILNKDSAPLWNYAKDNYNVTLDSVLFNDILLWLSYLGLNDGEITDEELKFINYILDSNFSKEDLLNNLANDSFDEYEDTLPSSFIVFYEFDKYVKENKNGDSGEIVESLFNIYGGIGQQFLNLNANSNNEDNDLKYTFDSYMANLRQNITDLKRFNYEFMRMSLNTEILTDIMNYNDFKKTLSGDDFKIVNDDMFADGSSFNTEYMDVLKDIFSNDHKNLDDASLPDSNNANESLDKFKKGLKNTSSSNFMPNENPDEGTGNPKGSDADKGTESEDGAGENVEEEESLEDILAKLNNLIGLENVKSDVNSLINLIQIRKIREERGIEQLIPSLLRNGRGRN